MRYLDSEISKILTFQKKMAFIAGPRQVGKTTLAQYLLKEASASENGYFNWDIDPVRRRIMKDQISFWKPTDSAPPSRITLDEIHKYPRWKRFLKGFFDANRGKVEVIVTGSGRLDVYQRGGDSLFGRYHLFRLLPYSVGELCRKIAVDLSPEVFFDKVLAKSPPLAQDNFERLWQFNGFPEPLFAGDKRQLVSWQNEHRQLILKEEMRDLTQIRELGLVESLVHLLPERIGSPLSINALRENLNINFKTVQNWLSVLERLYYLFSLRPFAGKMKRTLHREEKVYFYDWSELENDAKRWENMVALHLLKACFYWTDAGYGNFTLHYVRDKEKREVDFLVANKMRPFFLVEAKLSDQSIDPSLVYFSDRLKPQFACQIVKNAPSQMLVKRGKNILACSGPKFLSALP